MVSGKQAKLINQLQLTYFNTEKGRSSCLSSLCLAKREILLGVARSQQKNFMLEKANNKYRLHMYKWVFKKQVHVCVFQAVVVRD